MSKKKPATEAPVSPAGASADDQPADVLPARPVVQAISLIYLPGKGWSVLNYTVQGDKVLKVEATEPDIKLVAMHKFKVDAGNMLTSEEGGRVAQGASNA